MSFPAAVLLARRKAVPTILIALAMMVAGCLLMLFAANIANYSIVLLGLFVLASGITILQVAANPLAAALGPPEKSHFRLTFSQSFNSFGTFIGPFLGSVLFLKGIEVKEGTVITEAARAGVARRDRPRLLLDRRPDHARRLAHLGRPQGDHAPPRRRRRTRPARKGIAATFREAISSPWALFGGAAIFLYVGAEVAIGTQMALFLNSTDVWNIPLQDAGKLVSLYWGGAMVGRLVGSALLTRVKAPQLLASFTGMACLMCLYCLRRRRGQRGLCRARHRAVQLDHVPGDLHHHARALDRVGRGDLGLPVLLDHRRRRDPAARRPRLGRDQLRDRVHRPGDLLRDPVQLRDRLAPRAGPAARRAGGGDDPLIAMAADRPRVVTIVGGGTAGWMTAAVLSDCSAGSKSG